MLLLTSPLFWYKLVFMGELAVAEGLATYTLKKKPHFALRVVFSFAACEVIAFLFPIMAFNAFYLSAMFLLLFATTLLALKICYDTSWETVLVCGMVAYTVQHIAYETYNFFAAFLNIQSLGSVYGYELDYVPQFSILVFAVWLGSYGFTYWLVWAFVERQIRTEHDLIVERPVIIALSSLIVVLVIVLNSIVVYSSEPIGNLIRTVLFIYSLLSCSIALWILFTHISFKSVQNNLEIVQYMWEQDKKTHEYSKQTIDLINVKCHDLKKQIQLLRKTDGRAVSEALQEIESAVDIYDDMVKTGCDVLDLVLAEKSLYCQSRGIEIFTIADGQQLDFMSKPDLYSLFENAISNAIEAVEKIEAREKRIIRLKIQQVRQMISVHIENYFDEAEGIVIREDGLPQTSKANKNFHGFGVHSMQLIVGKYGGNMSFSVEDGIFALDIIFYGDSAR